MNAWSNFPNLISSVLWHGHGHTCIAVASATLASYMCSRTLFYITWWFVVKTNHYKEPVNLWWKKFVTDHKKPSLCSIHAGEHAPSGSARGGAAELSWSAGQERGRGEIELMALAACVREKRESSRVFEEESQCGGILSIVGWISSVHMIERPRV
jgi:hypothetical protein